MEKNSMLEIGRYALLAALVVPAIAPIACGAGGARTSSSGDTGGAGAGGASTGSSSDGGSGGLWIPGDAGPDGPPSDASCVGVESKATIVKKPIDFIVLPDESASMGDTRDAVANAMQTEVKNALDAAGIDYQVIWHGQWPLPGLMGKVIYNNVALGSGNSAMFTPVLDSFNSWSPAVRSDALKVFVQFTDATSGDGGSIAGYSGMFDDVILGLSPTLFGTTDARKFSHHVFIGISEKSTATDPWFPMEPVVGVTCGGNYSAAPPLEELARRNAGFRFPLCRPELFAGVFDRIAKTAIEGASVPCELVIPEPPAGETIDFTTVAVRYKAGDGTEKVFLRAKDETECAADRFLLDEASRRVTLCTAACGVVKVDPMATLTVLSGCDPILY
ncbi:MAG TPA: hypothetical protein PK156_23765 [Polyangium sp.]|nr:hypothetical protein [Polyangium sp.]